MKKKYLALSAIVFAGTLTVNAQTKKPTVTSKTTTAAKTAVTTAKATVLNRADSASYSFGYKIAQGLKSDGVTSLNYALLSKAMEDVFKDNKALLTDEETSKAIHVFLEEKSKAKFATAIEEGKKFLETNKTKSGITTTASGLQYEVLTAGNGAKPTAASEVTVHYKGTLLSGKQFDSSYDRGEPLDLQLNRVIPGWTEGVQLMSEGSKYRFYVPYQLAYGENGAGPDIPPYSTLIFEIELIKVK